MLQPQGLSTREDSIDLLLCKIYGAYVTSLVAIPWMDVTNLALSLVQYQGKTKDIYIYIYTPTRSRIPLCVSLFRIKDDGFLARPPIDKAFDKVDDVQDIHDQISVAVSDVKRAGDLAQRSGAIRDKLGNDHNVCIPGRSIHKHPPNDEEREKRFVDLESISGGYCT